MKCTVWQNSSLVIISNTTMWLWTKIRSDSDHPKNVVENYIPWNRIAPSFDSGYADDMLDHVDMVLGSNYYNHNLQSSCN